MKKLVYPLAVLLVALLLAGPMARTAAAMDPLVKQTELTGADWRGPRRPPPPPRPPRPAPRRDDRHHGGNFAGALIGSAIGGLIAGAIVNSHEPDVVYVEPAPPPPVYVQPAPPVYVQPAPPVYVQPAPAPVYVQPARPVLVCDRFGNCWYDY